MGEGGDVGWVDSTDMEKDSSDKISLEEPLIIMLTGFRSKQRVHVDASWMGQ